MRKSEQLVVIGGGIAGVSAAQAARQEYPGATITLLSAEPYPFYNRIALNTFVTGKRRQRHLHFYELDWLHSQRIEPRWGAVVEALEPTERLLRLAGGEQVRYDRLILATGASSVRPPIRGVDSEKVFTLWSLADAIRLRQALQTAESVFVLGAGVLGVETAIDLADAGKAVTLADVQQAVLPLHLDSESSRRYGELLARQGIELRLGATVVSIETSGRGAVVTTSEGLAVATDAVLLLAGVEPNIELARSAGLECGRGVIVDETLHTSEPAILACGNCVEHRGELRLLWNAAKAQGELAGLNCFETKRVFRPAPPVVHVKSPQTPLFVCGHDQSIGASDRELVDATDESYRKIVLGPTRRIKYIISLGDTRGSWELEKATTRETPIPDDVADVDGVIEACSPAGKPERRRWVCQMCGYTHESGDPPDLCPVCAVGKDQFLAA
jgi:NAD(P)H-nitrite reductase large subunit/rubredoxin